METLWTVSAPAWQWLLTGAVALWAWEEYLEHVWYKFKGWLTNHPHKK